MKNQQLLKLSTLSVSLILAYPAFAQVGGPASGQILKENTPTLQEPTKKSTAAPKLALPAQAASQDKTPYEVKSIQVTGNTVFTSEVLVDLIKEVVGQTKTVAELEALVSKLSIHYRNAGYPLVRALVSVSDLKKNTLTVRVVEGRYGEVTVSGVAENDPIGPKMFVESLKKGELIQSENIERVTLIVDDLPGIKVAPIIRPGKEIGAGDVNFLVNQETDHEGRIGYDNAGSRSTGKNRLTLDYSAFGVAAFGDRLSFTGRLSDDQLKTGSINWEFPVLGSGVRALVGYARTDYILGKQYGDLEANGKANVTTLQLSYPIVRSQEMNLYSSIGYQAKRLEDRWDAAFLAGIFPMEARRVQSMPVTLRFDKRDNFEGGGVTYGRVSWTPGTARLNDAALVRDQTTGGNTTGGFNIYNFDIARIQRLPENFSLYGRYSYQRGNRNLDPSEGFSLGGPNGVRAYPTSEGFADRGYIAQMELRYNVDANWTTFIFHDLAKSKSNVPIPGVYTPFRELQAAGLGVRQESGSWDLDATLAWRMIGGETLVENRDRDPRIFVNVGYKF